MKPIVFPAIISLCFLCGTGTPAFASAPVNPPDTLRLEKPSHENNDSIEYELVIFDPGFEVWYFALGQQEGYYSQSYLEHWNRQLVQQWNSFIPKPGRRDCTPETYLIYDTGVDYGLTLNHRLFMYFRYVHEKCRLFTSHPGVWN